MLSKAEKFTLTIDYLPGTALMARARQPSEPPSSQIVAGVLTANPSLFWRLSQAWVLELAEATGVWGTASSGLGKHMLYSYE